MRPGLRMRRLSGLVLAITALADVIANTVASPIISPDINTPETRQSWGNFDIHTNYYEVTPDTGRTVEVNTHSNFSER